MVTITTRASQLAPLTFAQVDTNFTNLKAGVDTAQATADGILPLLVASTGAGLSGYKSDDTYSIPTTVEKELREWVSVSRFMSDAQRMNAYLRLGTLDTSDAFQKAINNGKKVRFTGVCLIANSVITDRSDVVIEGDGRAQSQILSTVASGYTFVLGTAAVPSKGGLRLRKLSITRVSGTHSCVNIVENLDAVVYDCQIVGFYDYAIVAEKSDGLVIRGCLLFNGGIKAYSEMDRLVITENNIQACQNKPAVESYGGIAQVIEKNFINWNNHEAIVLGYDSARGDYAQSISIRNNYIERNCQVDIGAGGANRPFVHVGKPVDQTGAAYAGTEVVRWVDFDNNYINADVSNINLTKIIPVLFERVAEVDYKRPRVANFSNGGTNANFPRVKYPARNIHIGNQNTKYVDLSTGGQNAYQQVNWNAQSMYRQVDFEISQVVITTDASGNGNSGTRYNNIDTGVNGLDTGRLFVFAAPQADCRWNVNTQSITSNAASDGSDRASWRISVVAGPVSSSVTLSVRAFVIVP